MAYFLKKQNEMTRLYLSIYESFISRNQEHPT